MTEPLDEFTEGLILANLDLTAIVASKKVADPAGQHGWTALPVQRMVPSLAQAEVAGAAGVQLLPSGVVMTDGWCGGR